MKKMKGVERRNTGLEVCGYCTKELAGPNLSASNVELVNGVPWHPRCVRLVKRFLLLF